MIIADIGPKARLDRLAFGQKWNRRIVTMDARGGEDVRADQIGKRRQDCGAGADIVGDVDSGRSTPSCA